MKPISQCSASNMERESIREHNAADYYKRGERCWKYSGRATHSRTEMSKTLRAAVILSGIFIIVVSLTHIALGHSWLPDPMPVSASIDSEHRFYASIFLMYAVALLWCAKAVSERRSVFHLLLLTLFVGGLARIVSLSVSAWPLPLFISLGILELAVPPLLWLISTRSGAATLAHKFRSS
jgi:hypothetical protein